jgi:hypothetical protein
MTLNQSILKIWSTKIKIAKYSNFTLPNMHMTTHYLILNITERRDMKLVHLQCPLLIHAK